MFSSDRAGNGNVDLWLRDLKSGSDRRLTQLPTGDFGAAWSSDGKRVAFLSLLSHSSGADVYVVDVQNGQVKRIHHFDERNPTSPTWSPDGHVVMVAAFYKFSERYRESVYRLMAIPADGGEARYVDEVPTRTSNIADSGVDAGPVWSPDGRRLALVHDGLLQVMDVDPKGNPRGPLRALTREASHAPSWTGDSRHLLYLATNQLKLVGVDDGQVREVPLDLKYLAQLSERTDARPRRPPLERARCGTACRRGHRHRRQPHQGVVPHSASLHTGNVVDASAQTVIPGLIDMHAHVYREYGEALWRLLLSYGVTTGRETAGFAYRSLEYREAIESGARPGPRLFISAPTFDGSRTAFAEMYTVNDERRLEMEVNRASSLEYDLLKLYVRLPVPLQKRAVELAHQARAPRDVALLVSGRGVRRRRHGARQGLRARQYLQ